MDDWLFLLGSLDWRRVLVALLLAFGLGQAVAGAYVLTFRGLSYSRAIVQTLAVAALIPCMLMLAIGQSVAAALGIAGGLAIIRFRTSLRDPRDILFLFASFGGGIACGLQVYSVAIGGTAMFCLASLLLHFTWYGARSEFDGLLRFSAELAGDAEAAIARALRESCRSFACGDAVGRRRRPRRSVSRGQARPSHGPHPGACALFPGTQARRAGLITDLGGPNARRIR
jgi:hypothetical protein